ncbi:MAG: Ig-like domain-containing protein, partial [Betaproteobacteria bacterium]
RAFGTEDRRAELAAASASIRSESRTAINAVAGAASIAASFGVGGKSLAVSIGLSLAFNSIEADVTAKLEDVELTTSDGSIDMGARSAALQSGPTIDWEEIENNGLDEYSLDAVANAAAGTSYASDEGREWDYLPEDGETDLVTGDKFRATDGRIFEYLGDDNTIDLAEIDLEDADLWEEVETDTYELKTGYTVRVDDRYDNGGVSGLVYRFIGQAVDYTTLDGETVLAPGDVVLVEVNHEERGWVGRAFEWKGAQNVEIDLASEDFQNEDLWTEVSVEEEDVALWKEDYSDTTRWQLATDFADAETVETLTTIIEDAGVDLADQDLLRANATYSSADGTIWKYTNEDGEVEIEEGDLVADVNDDNAIYEYLGEDEDAFNLDEADFTDDDLWELVEPDTVDLLKGDTVKVAPAHGEGGTANAVYRYIGKNHQSVNLSTVDYSDDTEWELVKPELNLAVIEPGQSWRIVDGAGDSYTITKRLRADGSYDVSIDQVNINAVSVAASAAIGIAVGGAGLAFSGAGAVAVNTIRGNVDALIVNSKVESAGDLSVRASADSAIAATIAALSVAIAGGSSSAVGASIGIAVARNFIGAEGFGLAGDEAIATVTAQAIDSELIVGGELSFTAEGNQAIDALVVSGSAAVALGGGNAIGVSGSGVWAENYIGTRLTAGIATLDEPRERVNTVEAGSISVRAVDASTIDAWAGAVSVAAALGLGNGVAVSIGVTLARNVIDGVVSAGIDGAQIESAGDIAVAAQSDYTIDAFALAASAAIGLGVGNGIGVSGAGASALNVIVGDAFAIVEDSAMAAGGTVSVDAQSTSLIRSTIISASVGVGAGGGVGIGASVGVSIARNYVGYNPYEFAGAVTYVQGEDNPSVIRKGDTVRMGSKSGARANEVYEYIGDDDIEGEDANDDGAQDDIFLTQDLADTEKWKQLLTESANEIKALVISSSLTRYEPPEAPVVLDIDSDSGEAGDLITSITRPMLIGSGNAGDTIEIQDADGLVLATATVGSDGSWSATLEEALAEGLNTLSVIATDAEDVAGEPVLIEITVDTEAPDAPTAG